MFLLSGPQKMTLTSKRDVRPLEKNVHRSLNLSRLRHNFENVTTKLTFNVA